VKPHVKNLLAEIRHGGYRDGVPTREQIIAMQHTMGLSNGSFARLADISEGTMTSLHSGKPVSDEMLVYLQRVLDSTRWDTDRRTYGRICNGFLVQVGRSQRIGNGWARTGQFLPRRVMNLGKHANAVPEQVPQSTA